MKNLQLLLLASILSIGVANAQTANSFNPIVQNLHFTPEPNIYGFQNCSETYAMFNFGMTTQSNADSFATQPLKINICLQGFLPANINPAMTVYGVQSGYFDWTYDILTNCIQGVQNSTLYGTGNDIFNLDPRAFGEIGVRLQITPYMPVPSILDVDVALDIPNYMQVGNTIDDHEFATTQNYIGVTSLAGTLFVDTPNSSTPGGTPNGLPDAHPMFVNVIDVLTGLVEYNVLINSDGSYFIDSLRPERSYSITINVMQGTNGQIPPPKSLPTDWNYSSEDCCDNLFNDGFPDGTLSPIYANTCPIKNANFGIFKSPMVNNVLLDEFNVVLAVNELNFQVVEKECHALLFWNHTEENQYQRYDIMRKESSAANYTKIAEVEALKNSSDNYQYTFLNENLDQDKKTYQYQLRMVDISEKVFISPTRTFSLNCNGEHSIATLFPNPTKGNINLLFDNKNEAQAITVTIVDVAGKVIYNQIKDITTGQNNINLNIIDFPTGYYLMKYQSIDGIDHGTLKFAVQ